MRTTTERTPLLCSCNSEVDENARAPPSIVLVGPVEEQRYKNKKPAKQKRMRGWSPPSRVGRALDAAEEAAQRTRTRMSSSCLVFLACCANEPAENQRRERRRELAPPFLGYLAMTPPEPARKTSSEDGVPPLRPAGPKQRVSGADADEILLLPHDAGASETAASSREKDDADAHKADADEPNPPGGRRRRQGQR